ncbi:hypothetical protein EYM_05840 [Ignicoccus islandicus DSM 13165]|uniref:SSD domain-containing protein n=1 Tax=Ignicoccus islandicus DSM 13165 TaxID=940295 RepID=A0A0U3EDV3_9CREN|nr:MMPL family transporter [Ignicoccus islandicus]ALU12627.1 hypothetical protein EYM_05840 [Ignicoccus islandicus DSM 13165]
MKKVLAWVAIAIIAALFAAKLDSVLVYSETAMLPPQAESYKVKEAVNRYFPDLSNRTILMVSLKYNVTDQRVADWYHQWKNETGLDASSYIDLVEKFRDALKGVYNGLGKMVKGVSKGFAGYWMVTDLVHFTMVMNGLYDLSEEEAIEMYKQVTLGTPLEKYSDIAKTLYETVKSKKLDPNSLDESQLALIAKHKLLEGLSNDYARSYTLCLGCKVIQKVKGLQLWLNYGFDPDSLKNEIDKYVNETVPEAVKCFASQKLKDLPQDVAVELLLAAWEGRSVNLDQMVNRAIEEKFGDMIHYLMVSKDWKTMLITIKNASYEQAIEAKRKALKSEVVTEAYLMGGEVLNREMKEANLEDAERVQELSHVAVLLVLFAITRSVVASVIPFIVVGIGIVTGMALAYFLGQLFPIYQMAKTLMITTGLGLGMDYSIFILSRFKEELRQGVEVHEAAKIAAKRAGHAVGISALAASMGFASLALSGTLMLNSMGLTIPLVVIATAIASMTMLPELLALLGKKTWFWWPIGLKEEKRKVGETPVVPRKGIVFIAFVVVLVITIFSLYFYVNYKGSSDSRLFIPSGTEAYEALQKFSEKFPGGAWGPIQIYVERYNGFAWKLVKEQLLKMNGVVAVMDPNENFGTLKDGKGVGLVILKYEPFSEEALDMVPKIRNLVHSKLNGMVGGMPAELYDTKTLVTASFWQRVTPFAIIATMAVLALAVRKVDPVISAGFGLIAAISWAVTLSHYLSVALWGYPLYWITPMVALIATLGIGTDYNVFFITRIIEEIEKKRDYLGGVWRPLKLVGPIIFGLASIMASAYFGMLVARSIGLKQMGLALGFSALFAALNAILLNPIVLTVISSFKGSLKRAGKESEEVIE